MNSYGQIWSRIDDMGDSLWSLALRIHEHPELGFEERQAAVWLESALEESGFRVERGIANMPTAFRAVYAGASNGPTVAILAEYDALPEIGHACGHNLIAAISIGAALGLAPFKSNLPGTLVVLGSPAEEGGAGKQLLIDGGLLDGVDAALMVHPSSCTTVRRGALAKTEVRVSFQGKASHASSQPEQGVNALDAVMQTFSGINALRQHLRDGARIHGIITDGGRKPNIVPEHAAAWFYVRDLDNTYCDELVEKLRHCAEGAATATGAHMTFERLGVDYRAMKTSAVIAGLFEGHLKELGHALDSTPGGLGSTDMGNISWVVPSIHAYMRIVDRGVPGHSRQFAEASRAVSARRPMLDAAKAVAATCVDLFADASLCQKAREEFDGAV